MCMLYNISIRSWLVIHHRKIIYLTINGFLNEKFKCTIHKFVPLNWTLLGPMLKMVCGRPLLRLHEHNIMNVHKLTVILGYSCHQSLGKMISNVFAWPYIYINFISVQTVFSFVQ